jgi:ribosomal protein L37E
MKMDFGPRNEAAWAAARRLRMEEGLTIREIADRLGIAKSTAGDYVKGIEAIWTVRCRLCGQEFTDRSYPGSKKRHYCCATHRNKASAMRRYGWEPAKV